MNDVTGRVLWYCGLRGQASVDDKSVGKTMCQSPSWFHENIRHSRTKYGCGWYELKAIKTIRQEGRQ